jgi:hypothetical protein
VTIFLNYNVNLQIPIVSLSAVFIGFALAV